MNLLKQEQLKTVVFLLTDLCNMNCRFCFKKDITEKATAAKMDVAMFDSIVQFVMDYTGGLEGIKFHLWGGEPLLVKDVVTHALDSYMQVPFVMNTNGMALRDYHYRKFIDSHAFHLELTLSTSNFKERGLSVHEYIEEYDELLRLIKKNHNWRIHLIMLDPDNFVKDISAFYDYGLDFIIVDSPMYKVVDQVFIDRMSEAILEVFRRYPTKELNYSGTGYGIPLNSYLVKKEKYKPARYCGAGLSEFYFDYLGNIWACDGMYHLQQKQLGSIRDGLNETNQEYFTALHKDPSALYSDCKECKYTDNCFRPKCLEVNYFGTGDMLRLDKIWCMWSKKMLEIHND